MKRKSSERGASLVEYSLLVALLAIATMVGTRVLGQNINTQLCNVSNQLAAAGSVNDPCSLAVGERRD